MHDLEWHEQVAARSPIAPSFRAEEEHHLGSRIGKVLEPVARHLQVLVPPVAQLVSRALRKRITLAPEALDETIPLVVTTQRFEGAFLVFVKKERGLFEEPSVVLAERRLTCLCRRRFHRRRGVRLLGRKGLRRGAGQQRAKAATSTIECT